MSRITVLDSHKFLAMNSLHGGHRSYFRLLWAICRSTVLFGEDHKPWKTRPLQPRELMTVENSVGTIEVSFVPTLLWPRVLLGCVDSTRLG